MLVQDQIENCLKELIGAKVTNSNTSLMKLIVSEFQRRPNLNVKLKDEEVYRIINKFIKNNEELLKYEKDPEKIQTLNDENKFLSGYLPKSASEEDIKDFLSKQEINEKNKNKMVGMTIGHFKSKGLLVDGSVVKTIIDEIL